jgi:hypothetical protein
MRRFYVAAVLHTVLGDIKIFNLQLVCIHGRKRKTTAVPKGAFSRFASKRRFAASKFFEIP